MMNPSVVSTRSTLSARVPVQANQRAEFVRLKGGDLVSPSSLTLTQRLLCRNSDLFSISNDQQRLVFRNRLLINGWNVDYKLTMIACPDRNGAHTFIQAFYNKPGITHVTTGLLTKALSKVVDMEVSKNLKFVDVGRVPPGSPIKNASRHNSLAAACARLGVHLFNDTLELEAVS